MTMKRMKLDFSWDDVSKISQDFDNKGRYDWFHQTKFGSISKHTWKTDFLTSEVQFFRFKKTTLSASFVTFRPYVPPASKCKMEIGLDLTSA